MARLAASTAAATGLAGRGTTAVEVEGWLGGWRGGWRGATAVEVEGWLVGWRGGWRGVGGTAFCREVLGTAPEAAVGLGVADEVEGVGWPPPWPLLPVSGKDSKLLFLLLFLFLFWVLIGFCSLFVGGIERMEVSIISPSSSSCSAPWSNTTTSGAASPRPDLDVAASLPLLGLVLPPNPLSLSPPPSPL